MDVVVSDTSPIRALEWIGQLDLLEFLYGRVIVPPAVSRELLRSDERFRAIDVTHLPWVEIRQPADPQRLSAAEELDAGEAEALSLAVELNADLVLIDESAGRRKADALGLKIIGTVGILLRAKQRGRLPEIGPLIDELRNGLGFFLSDTFTAEVLKRANEVD
jgi:predicted nucleic acid-binding protein